MYISEGTDLGNSKDANKSFLMSLLAHGAQYVSNYFSPVGWLSTITSVSALKPVELFHWLLSTSSLDCTVVECGLELA